MDSLRLTLQRMYYYLDEAYKAQCGGATSAAIVMYRAALEQLLTEQGFAVDNCAKKIQALEANAPRWADNIEPEILKVVKDLGNDAIHVNSGDTHDLAVIDRASGSNACRLHYIARRSLRAPCPKSPTVKGFADRTGSTSKPKTP